MYINEIFNNIQGEARFNGVPTIFIRTQGCNLNCNFCDSKNTWPDNSFDHIKSIDDILEEVENSIPVGYEYPHNICITGGEPLQQQTDLPKLIVELQKRFFVIEIETNGTIMPNEKLNYLIQSPNVFLNISPKFGEIKLDVLKKLTSYNNSILKFVIEKPEDVIQVTKIIETLEFPYHKVYLMPEGIEDSKIKEKALWVVEACKKYGFTFTNRTHIWLWGACRGK